jgi:hypothetical protein
MNYAVGVAIYLVAYLLAVVLPAVVGAVSFGALAASPSPGLIVLLSVPVLFVVPRVIVRMRNKVPLVSAEFRSEGNLLRPIGNGIVALAHLLFFGSLGLAAYFALTQNGTAPFGLVAGRTVYVYLVGIVFVETSYWQWSRHHRQAGIGNSRLTVLTLVGLLVALNIAMSVGTRDRPVDVLPYAEREGLAWSMGLAREVQRVVERFYTSEGRLPCADDAVVDVESLLGRRRGQMQIRFIDCGKFTISVPRVEGVVDRDLLFVSEPSDSLDAEPLIWHCYSAYHDNIERHTRGKCVFDRTAANVP